MTRMTKGTDWVAVGGLSLLSVLMFQSGAFFLLFIGPLQFLRGKTDRRHFTIGCTAVALLIAGIVAWRASSAPEGLSQLALLDGLVPLGLIVAIWIVNEVRFPVGGRTAVLGVAGAIAGLVAYPSVSLLMDSELISGQIAGQLAQAEQALEQFSDGVPTLFGAESLEELVSSIWIRTFAGGFTLTLGANYLIGSRLSGATDERKLERYRTPEWLPFLLLAGVGGAVFEASFGLEVAGIPGWNLIVFTGGVFAAQGIGLLQFVAGANGRRPGRRAIVPLVLLVLFIVPFTGGVVTIGLPLLGLVEHWKHRRDRG